ncbi:MAG: LysR substrate-binding domain-containing protein [Pseudomonadota bacterium]
MKNLTLKQLRYFEALAQHGHFGRAADVAGVSQPALSMQIKILEDALGLPLFDRGSKTLHLTQFGEAVLERATRILGQIDDLGDLARAAHDQLSGRLRIGIIPTIAPYLLPRIVGHLNARFTQVDLHIRETITPRLIEELTTGRIDTAIVALPVSEPSLQEVPLFAEDFVLIRPAEDAGKPVPSPKELGRMRLLLLEEGHCFRDQALSFCSLRSPVTRDSLEGSSLSTLVQMVSAGIGVTLIPDMAVEVEARSVRVDIARFPAPCPSRQVGMIWRRTSPLADQLQDVADTVLDAVA